MKFSILAGAAIAQLASAHYTFDVLVSEGQESRPNEFIRANTRPERYNPTKWKNTRDGLTPDMDDFRCNLGSFTNAAKTGVKEVAAGTKMAMKLAYGATMRHPGPAFVYMSLAPDSVKDYEGDGEWFKIFQSGLCDPTKDILGTAWCTWDDDRIEFTIPADVPAGEYLIRSEHVGLHGAHGGEAEFYYGCAQVKVTGSGSGTPGPTVKFPGAYKSTDPEFNFSIWGGYKDYAMPAPAVWTGGNSGGAQSPVQSPSQTASQTPAQTATEEAPAQTSAQTPTEETPAQSATEEAPASTPTEEAAEEATEDYPEDYPEETTETPAPTATEEATEETPAQTLAQTSAQTPADQTAAPSAAPTPTATPTAPAANAPAAPSKTPCKGGRPRGRRAFREALLRRV